MIDEELRAILACPACKGELIFEETRIICPACRKAYPVRDGIPVMLIGGLGWFILFVRYISRAALNPHDG